MIDNPPLLRIVLVSAVVMGLSHTIAVEKVFAPLRERLGGMQTWPGYLMSCAYCVSHWLALLLVPMTGAYGIHVAPRWPYLSATLDWFLSSILVTVIAAFLRVGFYFVDQKQKYQKTVKQVIEDERLPHQAAPPRKLPIAPPETGA